MDSKHFLILNTGSHRHRNLPGTAGELDGASNGAPFGRHPLDVDEFHAERSEEARKWLDRELKRNGMTPATSQEFAEVFQRSQQSGILDKPIVKYQWTVDTINIRKPLLKIAYELSWRCLGDSWLRDPVAKKIRKVLRI